LFISLIRGESLLEKFLFGESIEPKTPVGRSAAKSGKPPVGAKAQIT